MAMVVARGAPDSAAVMIPYASAGVGDARHRLATDLDARGMPSTVVDDAVLVLSELISNALRHARPLVSGKVRAAWWVRPDGLLAMEVTDGGGATRPRQARPSLTSHGGRGLSIIDTLSVDWGVRGHGSEVTVWTLLPVEGREEEAGLPGLWDFDLESVEPLEG